jgi:hypothetical protein
MQGSYCGVSGLAAISLANQLCKIYGMDTIRPVSRSQLSVYGLG